MENFRLSHFSVIALKPVVKQRPLCKRKRSWMPSALPACSGKWVDKAFQEAAFKYSAFLSGSSTNFTPNLNSYAKLRAQGPWSTFKWRWSCCCLQMRIKKKKVLSLYSTPGRDQRLLRWEDPETLSSLAVAWWLLASPMKAAWACPISSPQLCSVLSSLLGNLWWLCFLSNIKSSTETATSMTPANNPPALLWVPEHMADWGRKWNWAFLHVYDKGRMSIWGKPEMFLPFIASDCLNQTL